MLGLISHPDCLAHDPGPLHPDTPDRLNAINNRLIVSGLELVARHYDAPLASREQLVRVHDPAYVDHVLELGRTGETVQLDGDTFMSPGTLAAALRAAGAGVLAVDLVACGDVRPVFCAVRPPGHHAERGRAMGFCIFDNVAVAAAHGLAVHGLERVAIVDFDVHHGNGTEHIFAGDERVLVCSAFQHPFYPYSGVEVDAANLVPVPLPAGTDGTTYRPAITEAWLPALERHQPQLVVFSAGFDGHALDDMSGWRLQDSDFAWVTSRVMAATSQSTEGRVVSMLEGGYEPDVLSRSVVAHIRAMQ